MLLEPGSLLGQTDEAFWVNGSSGSLKMTGLQTLINTQHEDDFA